MSQNDPESAKYINELLAKVDPNLIAAVNETAGSISKINPEKNIAEEISQQLAELALDAYFMGYGDAIFNGSPAESTPLNPENAVMIYSRQAKSPSQSSKNLSTQPKLIED